jgi:hypothetical protein
MSLLLCSSGISECEPKVIQQLLEFMYRMGILVEQLIICIGYTTDVLQDSLIYSEHAGKNELDLEDLRLGIKSQLKHMFAQPPSRDVHVNTCIKFSFCSNWALERMQLRCPYLRTRLVLGCPLTSRPCLVQATGSPHNEDRFHLYLMDTPSHNIQLQRLQRPGQ